MNLKKYHIIGFIFTAVLGTILHFTYNFFDKNIIIGYFTPVNESTWEHLKLLITPIIIFSIYEYFSYGKDLENFIIVKALSILLGMCVIVVAFYTYTGIIGKNYLLLDIGTFILASFLSYYFSYKMLKNKIFYNENSKYIGVSIIFIILILMINFTTNPPKINLFLDTTTNTYGIE
ncbi:DUF6512 family protein [[Clostridium] colinum]|uniref:DUF6512 family protein n=1 Tax=[Clostridium] colinum TaxID=36835 RepID=UPI00202590CE|nr:DUF6512 family protein [[Clostridium] colinum]